MLNYDDYASGYDDGSIQGYADGHRDGYAQGWEEATTKSEQKLGELVARIEAMEAMLSAFAKGE